MGNDQSLFAHFYFLAFPPLSSQPSCSPALSLSSPSPLRPSLPRLGVARCPPATREIFNAATLSRVLARSTPARSHKAMRTLSSKACSQTRTLQLASAAARSLLKLIRLNATSRQSAATA